MLCKKCKKELPEELFKSQLALTKFNEICRPCLDRRKRFTYPQFGKEYKAEWRIKNRPALLAYDKAYRKARKAKKLELLEIENK